MCRNCNDIREWPERTEREIEEAMRSWKEIEEEASKIKKIIESQINLLDENIELIDRIEYCIDKLRKDI